MLHSVKCRRCTILGATAVSTRCPLPPERRVRRLALRAAPAKGQGAHHHGRGAQPDEPATRSFAARAGPGSPRGSRGPARSVVESVHHSSRPSAPPAHSDRRGSGSGQDPGQNSATRRRGRRPGSRWSGRAPKDRGPPGNRAFDGRDDHQSSAPSAFIATDTRSLQPSARLVSWLRASDLQPEGLRWRSSHDGRSLWARWPGGTTAHIHGCCGRVSVGGR
jgi:hypothetical protein